MRRSIAIGLTLMFVTLPALGAKMTYEEAKQRLKPVELPAFWVGDVKDLPKRLEEVKRGEVRTIATSPGGRPLHLVAYGRHEAVSHRANFNSAIGGQDPSAYLDKAARTKPVILFVGPVHGHEVEGLTGLVNLIQVMETGRDLAGRERKELRELGEKCRLLIIPAGNPDGIARFEPRAARAMTLDEFQFWGQGTWANDEIAYWPISKRRHPFTGDEVKFIGCYFDDAGVNPMHDEFFAPMGPEAPAILKVAMEEGPDLAVSLHSHGSAPAVLRPAYVPMEVQEDVRRLAETYYALSKERELPHGGLPQPKPEGGQHPAPFNLTSAMYHVSGATAFTHECPHGIAGDKWCQVTFEQILEIQLTLYEAMIRFALEENAARGL